MFLYSTVSTLKPEGRTVSALRGLGSRTSRRTNGGDRGDDFTELQLVQNGRLSGSIEANHQNTHLLLAP
jgi:hypothetical protein